MCRHGSVVSALTSAVVALQNLMIKVCKKGELLTGGDRIRTAICRYAKTTNI